MNLKDSRYSSTLIAADLSVWKRPARELFFFRRVRGWDVVRCYVYIYLCCFILQLRMDEHYGHQINNYFSEDVAGFAEHIFG